MLLYVSFLSLSIVQDWQLTRIKVWCDLRMDVLLSNFLPLHLSRVKKIPCVPLVGITEKYKNYRRESTFYRRHIPFISEFFHILDLFFLRAFSILCLTKIDDLGSGPTSLGQSQDHPAPHEQQNACNQFHSYTERYYGDIKAAAVAEEVSSSAGASSNSRPVLLQSQGTTVSTYNGLYSVYPVNPFTE